MTASKRGAKRRAPAGAPVGSPARSYHHGELRAALVRSAIALLREGEPNALTLRAVARAAGVSEAAPYRHFSGRASLLVAVAEDGFRRLRACMMDAALAPHAPDATDRAALQALGLAYIRFGVEHPAEYAVMFGREIADMPLASLPATYLAESRGTLALLERGISALQARGGIRPGDPSAMATCAWATMHGLVTLALGGQIDGSPDALMQMGVDATLLLMYGMSAPS